MKDLVIIGSGPAGLSAAVYAKRAMMDVVVLEKEPFSGGQIINTERVDNYLGLYGIEGYEMGMKFREHADELGVEFADGEVADIKSLPDRKQVVLENGETIETKALIIATGAKHKTLGVPGEKEFTGAGVSYCATCDGAFFRNKAVAVVGGGDVALEDALYLSKICSHVTLIHRRDEFRAAKILADEIEKTKNIEFLPFTQIREISGEPGSLVLEIENTKKNEKASLTVSGVFIAVGMSPVTGFAKNAVALDATGYICAGEDCKTNVDGIFAIGDVRTKRVRQVATAVGDGATVMAYVEDFLKYQ